MIQNLNPSLFEILPDLTGGLNNNSLRRDPVRPDATWLRPIQASTGVRSNYVVPGDWPNKPDHWFADDAVTYPRRNQNNVEYLIDGEPTYEAMVEAIETATGADHFIVLLGWTLHVDFTLSTNGKRSAGALHWLINILKARLALGVTLRVLLYKNQFGDGILLPPVFRARRMLHRLEMPRPSNMAGSGVLCVIDEGYRGADGCHHQKVLLVHGSEGLIGFFGGIDFNPDRVEPTPEGGPLHDVHARVVGEAAGDLMVLATNRWNFSKPHFPADASGNETPSNYPSGRSIFDMNELLERSRANPTAPPGPHRAVKIGHTVGNPDLAKKQDNGAWPNVRKALKEAKKFIYMEDQYLFSIEAVEELGQAAHRISGHITILIPPDDRLPLDLPWEVAGAGRSTRHAALKRLKEVCGGMADKIAIYVIKDLYHSYIHAKMFVVDDEVAIIGSANSNNRGYFYDSEDNGVIADLEWTAENSAWGGKWWQLDLALAHKLRMELWSEHLNMPAEALIDGVAAEFHWRNISQLSKIKPYRINGRPWHEHEYDSFYVVDRLIDPRP
jgi:phosphatidylserine/phosphatidylglycerophosphate/cardiolipin synthase-like enzyme